MAPLRKSAVQGQHPNDRLRGKLKGVAKMYEQQFLQQMVKAMRSTVSHSEMTKPSMAENLYKEQLDQKYVESWSDQGGTGFADMIYRDLVEKYFPHLEEKKAVRPKPLTKRFRGFVKTPPVTKVSEALGGGGATPAASQNYLMALEPSAKASPLSLPYKGVLEKAFTLPDGKQVAQFRHGLGMTSTFVFDGSMKAGQTNNIFDVGENFAQLSPNSTSMIWQIHKPEGAKQPKGAEPGEF